MEELTMKKVALLIAMAALVLLAGCNKETQGTVLKASIEQNNNGRTSLNPIDGAINWTTGDKILVNNGTSSVTFNLTAGANTTNGTFTYNGDYTFGVNNVAVYPETATISGNTVSLTLSETQVFTAEGTFGNGTNPMLGSFTDSESLIFTSLCGGLGISLKGDNIDITAIEVETKANEALNGAFECTAANPVLVPATGNSGTNKVRLNCATTLTATAQSFYFVLPVGTLAQGFTLKVYNGGDEPIFSTETDNNISIVLNTVNIMPEVTVVLASVHEYVDLGLPSGLLWATCNVGANSPEEYGHYFAWGETVPKDYYDWNTYQYCTGWESTLTKYCYQSNYGYCFFTDDLTVLLPEDDAATANWGGNWRMPTKEEWQELLDNTTHTETTYNGVNGRQFTAANGNSLFFPAAGYRFRDNLNSVDNGDYWSSSLSNVVSSDASNFYFEYGMGEYGMGGSYRRTGMSVRAVRSGQN